MGIKAKKTLLNTPQRFRVSRRILFTDNFMSALIVLGGLMVIAAVFGIFLFILKEALPLFGSAKVQAVAQTHRKVAEKSSLGVDEWGRMPFAFNGQGEVSFYDLKDDKTRSVQLSAPEGQRWVSWKVRHVQKNLVLASSANQVGIAPISYRPVFENNAMQRLEPVIGEFGLHDLCEEQDEGYTITQIDHGGLDDSSLFAAIYQNEAAQTKLKIMVMKKTTSLLSDEGEYEVVLREDLTRQLQAKPLRVLVNNAADGVLVVDEKNQLYWFGYDLNDDSIKLVQTLPAPLMQGEELALIDWVFGDVSLVVGGSKGSLNVLSLYPQKQGERMVRQFGVTKSFEPMGSAPLCYVASQNNKLFFVASADKLRLCHMTTGQVRAEVPLDFKPEQMALTAKFEKLFIEDSKGELRMFAIEDHHPEAGVGSFFAKLQYEGFAQPQWTWQSTSGNDDFEPKLSLVPLIWGSLKGTLYAMLIAVPLALCAAVYTSQFMSARWRGIIKPAMEVMASLPSVVLGFFGALFLAPLLETRIPSIISFVVLTPLLVVLLSLLANYLPQLWRNKLPKGCEFALMIPLVLLCALVAWNIGAGVERVCFSLPGADGLMWTADDVVDFRLWWSETLGLSFTQRNSLIVGIVMGFAVIPIIYTISEDALSNVPQALVAASEALGSSRWQTLRKVVLPIASAGIFSSLMIGLGRALGETMIVLMATGNSPIMEVNIFSGMRSLAANIATELPEAAPGSTHYRVLFLSGLILFAMTFILNTVAEIVRKHFREKYKLV